MACSFISTFVPLNSAQTAFLLLCNPAPLLKHCPLPYRHRGHWQETLPAGDQSQQAKSFWQLSFIRSGLHVIHICADASIHAMQASRTTPLFGVRRRGRTCSWTQRFGELYFGGVSKSSCTKLIECRESLHADCCFLSSLVNSHAVPRLLQSRLHA